MYAIDYPCFPDASGDLPKDWREALLNERMIRLGGVLVGLPADDARSLAVTHEILATRSDLGGIGELWRLSCRIGLSANRFAKYQREKVLFPYLRYRSDHYRKHRGLDHESRHGIILRVDNPTWQWMFPPNGWGCNCRIEQVSEERMRHMGWSVTRDRDIPSRPKSDGFDGDWGALWPRCRETKIPFVTLNPDGRQISP